MLMSLSAELQRGECAVTWVVDRWLQQKLNRVCGVLEREYFLLLGCKSVYLWEDPTSTFPPMHKSFPFLPQDSKQPLGVVFPTKPVQSSLFPFLSMLAELIQTEESVF